jgi:putative restriction endonuclease
MPFIHREREIWELRDASGAEIGPRVPESGSWLTGHGAVGRLRPTVEQLLVDPGTLAAAARLLLDLHFTPGLSGMICDAVGLDLAVLELAGSTGVAVTRRSVRRPGFAEEVLRAYAYQCAMCGFDGALGRNPVGIEAAHVRWHCQAGPDVVANGLSLCALHHALFDLGVLGLTPERRIRVSDLYVARSEAGRGIVLLADRALIAPMPGQPVVELDHIGWHGRQAHLHSAVTQARSQVPRFGHGQSQRSTRSRSAAENARQDFPTGLSPTQAAAGPARPESSQPDHVSPQRTGPRRAARY